MMEVQEAISCKDYLEGDSKIIESFFLMSADSFKDGGQKSMLATTIEERPGSQSARAMQLLSSSKGNKNGLIG